MNTRAIFLLAAVFTTSSCATVQFRFGKAPRAPRIADPIQTCIWKHKIVLRPAEAAFETQRYGGSGVGTYSMSTVERTIYWTRGYTFYRGGERLNADEVLDRLGDRGLAAAYRSLYVEKLTSSRSKLSAGVVLVGLGVVLVIAGAGLAAVAATSDEDLSESDTLWAGVGMLAAGSLAGSLGTFFWGSGRKRENEATTFQTIFIASDLLPRLRRALERYNARVEEECAQAHVPAPRVPVPTAPREPAPRPRAEPRTEPTPPEPPEPPAPPPVPRQPSEGRP